MRRIGVCEERGSGIDKVVFQTEYYQLPAPYFEITGKNTRAVLFAHRPLNKMDKSKWKGSALECATNRRG